MRRSLAVLALGPALMATQCYQKIDVHVSPGPKPGQAVITGVHAKEPVELQELTVTLCRPMEIDRVVWSGNGGARDSVLYGTSEGFFAERPPEPLAPGGCYEVSARGRLHESRRYAWGFGGFRVRPDGTVIDGTGAPGRRLNSSLGIDRAAVGCRRAYRRARTEPDSAGVDARVWPVSDTAITCRFLRQRFPETIASTESTERVLLEVSGALAAIAALLVLESRLHLNDP
jgi:hypothetical protein